MEYVKKNEFNFSSSMQPPTSGTSNSFSLDIFQEPVFVIFEVAVVIISFTIVFTSILVIQRIWKLQGKRSRSDLLFITLSLSDVIVGLFTVPVNGIYWYFIVKKVPITNILTIALTFCGDFPYYFSYWITVVIAIDRMFIITFYQKYKKLIKPKVLTAIVIMLFLFTITYSSVCAHFMQPENRNSHLLRSLSFGYYITSLASATIVLLGYTSISIILWRCSNKKNLSRHGDKKHNENEVTVTIIYIFTSQCICIFPYSIFWILPTSFLVQANVAPWIGLLRNCQCFCNSLILLCNKKKQRIYKEMEMEEVLIKDHSVQ